MWNTPQDIALIKSIGFDHARLSVMWDYSGGFGAVIKKDGVATVDELTVKALGP